MSAPRLYLIAGEPSGDRLGAALIRALGAEAPGVEILGIGGPEMRAAGLEPLFPIEDLAVMGIVEVLPRLPRLLSRLREATRDVLARRPDALVTIDAPGFGLRVAERVRARDPAIRTMHYVAPTVWAWRPGRARQMARYVDHVLALFPFEPPFMEAEGMSCDFVGHPVAELPVPTAADRAAARAELGIAEGAALLMVAPGSRRGELRRHLRPFADAVRSFAARRRDVSVVVPVVSGVADLLPGPLAETGVPLHLVPAPAHGADRLRLMGAADLGLLKSGTVTLEAAAAGLPHVSAYRTSALTAAILRRVIRVDTGHMVNLVSGEKVIPERFQEACTGPELAAALTALSADWGARQAEVAERALVALGRGGSPPSLRAARSILAHL